VANSRSKQWRKDHPEQAKTNVANWVATHQDQLRRLHREYMTKRRKTDPKFAVLCRLRSRLRKAFQRYSKNGKIKPSREYGIDYCAIFEHLGPCPGDGWEIDHIIPLALFDLDDPEQVREAFAPENHQWLLKPDNIRKGKKLTTCANDRFDEPIETIQSL
jgi:5-methylcytosine-specific restriction endonuclease McrA